MKIYLRFLRSGLVEVEAPPGFSAWSPREQLCWGSNQLQGCGQQSLICAMADFDVTVVSCRRFFDNAPRCAAVEIPDPGSGNDPETVAWNSDWECFAFDHQSDKTGLTEEA